MRILKRSVVVLSAMLIMASLSACGAKKDVVDPDTTESASTESATTEATTEAATAEATTESATAEQANATDAEDTSIISEDEAIELVKQEMGGDFSYIPADELEERDGGQYYVIYVKQLLDTGNLTTLTTYLVKTDGSEVFDMYVTSSYVGEYVHSGATGETTFKVFEDGSFEMITTGNVNQEISGLYEFGITSEASVIQLNLYPHTSVVENNGETTESDMTGVEGIAIIENGELTLTMESEEMVFIQK